MKVLHICNDFCGSKVHGNLYRELDAKGVEQIIYTYFSDANLCNRNRFESLTTEFIYRPILRPIHRVLYHKKQHDVYEDIQARLLQTIRSIDLVHATTLFSDGGLAHRLYKKYGIPYMVSVRNTDINLFWTYLPHTWATGIRVLLSAGRIVFISQALKEKFCRHPFIRLFRSLLEKKFVIQPNGIDDYWLDNIKKDFVADCHNVLYVGRFNRNKNVMRLCRAIVEMRSQYDDIQLHLVGDGKKTLEKVMKIAYKYPQTIIYHGKIYEHAILKELYSQCGIFAMPSFHETFGLVYLEALSQHLAIVYTKGQGVDGMLDVRVGEAVKASSKTEIKNAIRKIMTHRDKYLASEVIDFSQYRWSVIVTRYIDIYTHVKEDAWQSPSKS